jgi:N-acetylglucosamine-6-sulfatase
MLELLTTARPPWVRGRFDDVLRRTPGDTWRTTRWRDKPRYLRQRAPLNPAERAGLLELARQRAEALWVADREVARTVAAVRRTGEADDTVVVFTSDNGFFLGEQRMRQGKIFPHEPSLRVPLLMSGPGIPAGERRSDPFTSIDLAPTLAALAGVQPGHRVDGVSLADVARTGDRGWTRGVLTETGPMKSRRRSFLLGVRTPRYLYVDVATGERELYDLRRDPQQLRNLAGRPAYADVQRQLARVLARLQDCRGEACARPLPRPLRG